MPCTIVCVAFCSLCASSDEGTYNFASWSGGLGVLLSSLPDAPSFLGCDKCFSITMLATHAPVRVCLEYCGKYHEAPKLERKLGHV